LKAQEYREVTEELWALQAKQQELLLSSDASSKTVKELREKIETLARKRAELEVRIPGR
jgi:chromosome segregation ATPase